MPTELPNTPRFLTITMGAIIFSVDTVGLDIFAM